MTVSVRKCVDEYDVTIQAFTLHVTRAEYESLILQLTGQLAKLDEEDAND